MAAETTGDAVALETFALSKRYGRRVWALTDISVRVPRGLITALVGPNAAGKSTLIRSWMGFEAPTSGSVRVQGLDPIRNRRNILPHIGYVPQQPGLYRDLTVGDHLAVARHYRPSFDVQLATSRLTGLGIPLRARARELSGGQVAQVSLAIAISSHAEILLLDEPLANLDPLARREFLLGLRQAVAAEGATAVMSSHSVSDVEFASDRLVVLGVGRKLLDDSLVGAVAGHRLAETHVAAGDMNAVANIATSNGGMVALVRVAGASAAAAQLRPASLEDVVLGYLAYGRSQDSPTV